MEEPLSTTTSMEVDPQPHFTELSGIGYHGTLPKYAKLILAEQKIKPSRIVPDAKYKPWYGEGIYLYEEKGIYHGYESARHYVEEIRYKEIDAKAVILEVEFNASKMLDMTDQRNFQFMLQVIIPEVIEQTGQAESSITSENILTLWKKDLDPDIDAIRGCSFEGKGIGLEKSDFGNLLLDVQSIICLSSPSSIGNIRPHSPTN